MTLQTRLTDLIGTIKAAYNGLDSRITTLEGAGGANSFYIWAEENGGIANNGYEWSFGNGATGADIGVPMMVDAELTHMSVNADVPGTSVTMVARRQVSTGSGTVVATTSALNGTTNRVYTLPSPILFSAGDMLVFQTGTIVGTWTDVRVGARFVEV